MNNNRKKEIVETAAKLFRKKGYSAVSMRDLAQELGIKAASLYNHIQSKQEILALVIMRVAANFTMHIDEGLPKNGTSIEKLEEIIRMHVAITIQKIDFLACLNNDWIHLDDKNRVSYLEMRTNYESKFREILQQGMKADELEKRDPEIMVFSILTTLRTLYLWYGKHQDVDASTLKEDLVNVLLQGIIQK